MYVWLDALTNYLTAAGWLDDEASYQALWPANIHMVGKDIALSRCLLASLFDGR